MNTRSIHIVAKICLAAMALLAAMPARSSPTGALPGNAVGRCPGQIDLPQWQVKNAPSNFTTIYDRKNIAPCTEEERANKKDENAAELARTIPPLAAWIVAKTGWTVHEAPPIRFIAQAQLTRMFGGASNLSAHALYSDADHTIYLPDGWKPNSLLDRSALLHELVHHLQYLNHVPATCPAEYEWLAYKLQVAWLREQGVKDPLEFMGISPVTIYILSRCPEF